MDEEYENVDWRRSRQCSTKYCEKKVDSTHIRITKCPKCRQKQRYSLLSAKTARLKLMQEDIDKFERTILCKVCSKSLLYSKSMHFCSYRCSFQFDLPAYKHKLSLCREFETLKRLKENYENDCSSDFYCGTDRKK